MEAVKSLPSPDEAEQFMAGQPPAAVATGLQKLRAGYHDAMQPVAEAHPDEAFQTREKVDEDFNTRIAAQRDAAVMDVAQKNFQTGDQAQEFSTLYDQDHATAAQVNPEATKAFDDIQNHPAFQEHRAAPAFKINTEGGDELGWAQPHPDMHGGYDVHVNLANGKGSGSFKLKGNVTKADAFKAFTESKIGKKAGEYHPLNDFEASFGRAYINMVAAVTDKIPGQEKTAKAMRQIARQGYERAAKTTAVQGGKFVSAGAEMAGKLPIWAFPGGMPAEMFADSEARGKNLADDIEKMAEKEADPQKKAELIYQASQVRARAPFYGALSAATAMGAGKLVSFLGSLGLNLALKFASQATKDAVNKAISEKVKTLLGTSAAEIANITSIELMQGQLVDPVFGFDRAPLSNLINPGNILFGAVFGAKRYYSKGAKNAREESKKASQTVQKVESGEITSPQPIYDALHGKVEDTQPTGQQAVAQIQPSNPVQNFREQFLKEQVSTANIPAESPLGKRIANGEAQIFKTSYGIGVPVEEVHRNSLVDILPEGTREVFSETSLDSAKRILARTQEGARSHSDIWVSPENHLALGQGGKGTILVFDPTKINGHKPRNLANQVLEGSGQSPGEFVVDKTVPSAVTGVIVRSIKHIDSLKKLRGFERLFDVEHPEQTERGLLIKRRQKIIPADIQASNAEDGIQITSAAVKRASAILSKTRIGRLLLRRIQIVPDWQRAIQSRSFSPEEMEMIKRAEGFHDPQTGKSVVITENIRPHEGETPEAAVIRVITHELEGHERNNWMRAHDSDYNRRYLNIARKIPKAELDALLRLYPQYKGNPDALAAEWFAQKAQSLGQGELPDPQSLLGQLWRAIAEFLKRLTGQEKGLDQQVRRLIIEGRRTPESLEGSGGVEGGIEPSVPFGPQRQFQQTNRTKEKGTIASYLPWNKRAREAMREPFKQVMNAHDGIVNAGNMAFEALGKRSRSLGDKLDKRTFRSDSLLGAAISHYIEANGDVQLLTDRRDALLKTQASPYAPTFDKAIHLTQPEKDLAQQISKAFAENIAAAHASGQQLPTLKDYVQHIWDKNNNGRRPGYGAFMDRFDSDPAAFQKRKLPTIFDGLMQGLTPATMDAFKLVGVNGRQISRAISMRKTAQQVTELRGFNGAPLAIINSDQATHLNDSAVARLTQLAASGTVTPVQMRSYQPHGRFAVGGDPVTNFDPTGYRAAKGNGIQGYYYQLPAEGGGVKNYWGELLFHPEVVKYVDARTGSSWFRQKMAERGAGGLAVKLAFVASREIKASLLGALSAFHYVQEGFHGIGHLTDPVSHLFKKIDPLDPETLQWMKSGLMLGGEHDAVNLFEGGSLSGNVRPLGFLQGNAFRRMASGENRLLHEIPILGFLSQKMSEHLFTRYIPSLKLATAQNAYKRNLGRFQKQLASGTMGDAEVRHITATAVNDAYGHINWADLGVSRFTRDFMQLFALAPDFLMARARFAIQASGANRLRGMDRAGSGREAFMAFFVLAATQYIAARLANYFTNDGDARMDLKDAFAWVNKEKGWRLNFRSVPGDVLEAYEKPMQFFENRASPMARDLWNIAFGTNWRGDKIGIKQASLDSLIASAPMTVQPFLKNYTSTGEGSSRNAMEEAARSAGIKIEDWIQYQEVKHKAFDYMAKHGGENDYHKPSAYTALRSRLFAKDEEGAKKAVDKLTGGDARKLEAVVKGFKISLFRAWTGDSVHDVNFKRELAQTDEGKQLLRDAERQQLEAWNMFLRVAQVPTSLREKYKGQPAKPKDDTLNKARNLRLAEAAQ